jgi:hypothetical protein
MAGSGGHVVRYPDHLSLLCGQRFRVNPGPRDVCAVEPGCVESGTFQSGEAQDGLYELGRHKSVLADRKSPEIGTAQISPVEQGPVQTYPPKVRAAQIAATQVCPL